MATEHPNTLRSIAIGLEILECFDGGRQVLSLAELTAMLDLGDPAKLRPFTSVLLAGGYLEQTAAQDYRLGALASNVALAILDTLALRWRAGRALARLRARTGYTTSLVALDGLEVVYINQLAGSRRGQHQIDDGIGVGARLPAHRTAAGKVLLAHIRSRARADLIAEIVREYRGSDHAVTGRALQAELRSALRSGLAVSGVEESHQSIAAPVRDEAGVGVVAIEVSVPGDRVSPRSLIDSIGPQLVNEAKTIFVTAEDFLGRT